MHNNNDNGDNDTGEYQAEPPTEPNNPDPMKLIRIKDKATGHEYTIRAGLYDPHYHTKTDNPPTDIYGEINPPTYN